ncbi:cupredoxin domain-containing protein [Streptomyces sp. H27-D2]|uniref:cupredoxin domain-containing protein n=1 Tax=Streptomyces sp. H27-D2 TaxID=3046304 RepID=UPI002DB77990|nr:cupredoxin domain-containing protein [Streptomyces sp. H27-D2]MEC4018832.1 cupredoxin domain-containing protein [Streptomyces sp. H27-D2]
MPSSRSLILAGAAALALPLLAACGGDTDAKDGAAKIAITATDTTCDVAKADLPAGKATFAVTNKGDQTTEVYVYGEHDGAYTKVVGEVENIGPSTSRDLQVDLSGGTYEIACKPGQRGDGIRSKLTVAGGTKSDEDKKDEAAYDREVEVEASDFALEGLKGFTAKAGEKIEFKLENKGKTEHELEVFGPDGTEVGEVAPVKPDATGEAVLTLAKPGTYTFKCGIGGHADQGMKGTFTVR